MIRKCCNGIFGKSVEFCSLLGNKNFYHVQLSVIISMFVKVRSELGGAASGLTIFFALSIFTGTNTIYFVLLIWQTRLCFRQLVGSNLSCPIQIGKDWLPWAKRCNFRWVLL